jgi:hypothetical protein
MIKDLPEGQDTSDWTYDQKRAASYPSINDYMDAIVKGDEAALQKYKEECLAVKAMYPKPE